MWLWAASKMWFGPGSFALIEKEHLLTLPVGKVSTRDDGVVVVELFGVGDEIGAIREAQRAFRNWLDYDDVEARAGEMVSEVADPCMEFEVGSFPHGGGRRAIEWLSGGRLAPKSIATERRLVELDADGMVLWEETAGRD